MRQSSLLVPYILQIEEHVLLFGRAPDWFIVLNFSLLPPAIGAQAYLLGEMFAKSSYMLRRCTKGDVAFAIENFEMLLETESKIRELMNPSE